MTTKNRLMALSAELSAHRKGASRTNNSGMMSNLVRAHNNYSGGMALTERVIHERFVQAAFLPAKGVGVNGTFNVSVSARISNNDGNWSLWVSASGDTAAKRSGRVSFFANAELLVDGVVRERSGLARPTGPGMTDSTRIFIGTTTFNNLPTTGTVQLRITSGYIFRTGHGAAVPMPGTLTRTIEISD